MRKNGRGDRIPLVCAVARPAEFYNRAVAVSEGSGDALNDAQRNRLSVSCPKIPRNLLV